MIVPSAGSSGRSSARSTTHDVVLRCARRYIDVDPAATAQIQKDWDKWGRGVPLVVLPSPFRSLMEPLLEYIEQLDRDHPDDYVTVVCPNSFPPVGGTIFSTISGPC